MGFSLLRINDGPDFTAFPARYRGCALKKRNKLGLFTHIDEKARKIRLSGTPKANGPRRKSGAARLIRL
jgi:hypothetical protein